MTKNNETNFGTIVEDVDQKIIKGLNFYYF